MSVYSELQRWLSLTSPTGTKTSTKLHPAAPRLTEWPQQINSRMWARVRYQNKTNCIFYCYSHKLLTCLEADHLTSVWELFHTDSRTKTKPVFVCSHWAEQRRHEASPELSVTEPNQTWWFTSWRWDLCVFKTTTWMLLSRAKIELLTHQTSWNWRWSFLLHHQ